MDPESILLLATLIPGALILILIIIGGIITTKRYLLYAGERIDTENTPTNLSPDNFDFLYSREFNFYSSSKMIKGYFYYQDYEVIPEKVIVLVHGFFAGHINYLNVIASFVEKGYLVFAYDNYGCNESEGESVRSFSYAPTTLKDALEALLAMEELLDFEFIVIGHSWGGYAAVFANKIYDVRLNKIFAISGFSNPIKEILYQMKKEKLYPLYRLYKPYVTLLEKMRSFSLFTSIKAQSALKLRRGREIILLHSKKDKYVPYSISLNKVKVVNPHIKKILLSDNYAHLDFNLKSREYVKEVKMLYKDIKPEDRDEFKDTIDYEKIKITDPEIMKIIFDNLD